MGAQIIFLGTGAGCGAPSFFYTCVACRKASVEPRCQRSRCALLIRDEQNTLIDTLILGAAFWGRNWLPNDHLSVKDAAQIGLRLNVKKIYLPHPSLHHDTPVTNREREAICGLLETISTTH